MDYDAPSGPRTSVAVLRMKATDPRRRIGSLFVNPGGPGGSGTFMAAGAAFTFGRDILERFDIVGFDPRGTNLSSPVRCWSTAQARDKDLAVGQNPFPIGRQEEAAAVRAFRAFGRACSTTGRPLSGAVSTAEVARDMDVLRRALGDRRLTFFGQSYGSYLGQVYANMFPDRVRAVVIDGVIDPVAWAGTRSSASIPQSIRLQSAQGENKALREILTRCGKAGARFCTLARIGDATDLFEALVARAKQAPITIDDPANPANPTVITYPAIYATLDGMLYDQRNADRLIDTYLTAVITGAAPAATAVQRAAAAGTVRSARTHSTAPRHETLAISARRNALGGSTSYDNSLEARFAVECSDGLQPRSAARWPTYAAEAERIVPGFGPLWAWQSAPCASSTWTVRDEDRYTGPFTRRTAKPVLVVGNFYDPATNYAGAVAASKLLPNSRLLRSDSFGHTAYGSSTCVTSAVQSYLLNGSLPARSTLCVGPQPFTTPLPASATQGD